MTRPAPFPFPVTEELAPALREEVLSRRSLSVYRMIMHTPAVAPAFLMLSDALRHQTSLPGNWRELAILRVGHRYQAAYEVHHHERLARSVGLGDEAIAATRPGGNQSVLDTHERTVIALVDELLQEHGLSDVSRDRALAMMTPNQLADMVLTVGFYQLVCNFLTTFGVPIEEAA